MTAREADEVIKRNAKNLSSKANECCEPKKNDCNFEVRKTQYRNVLQTTKQIYYNEGIGAFKKGMIPRMMINVPSAALSWGTYEFVKNLLIDK